MMSGDVSTKSATVRRPRVYLDADVLLAGAASSQGASHIVIKLCELSVVEGVISETVQVEVERNLLAKLPAALPVFRALVRAAKLRVVPAPTAEELATYAAQADPKDLVHLAAACLAGCEFLITHNTRHYAPQPGDIIVEKPGQFLERIRAQLARLAP